MQPYIFSLSILLKLFSFRAPPHQLLHSTIHCRFFSACQHVSCHIHRWYLWTFPTPRHFIVSAQALLVCPFNHTLIQFTHLQHISHTLHSPGTPPSTHHFSRASTPKLSDIPPPSLHPFTSSSLQRFRFGNNTSINALSPTFPSATLTNVYLYT